MDNSISEGVPYSLQVSGEGSNDSTTNNDVNNVLTDQENLFNTWGQRMLEGVECEKSEEEIQAEELYNKKWGALNNIRDSKEMEEVARQENDKALVALEELQEKRRTDERDKLYELFQKAGEFYKSIPEEAGEMYFKAQLNLGIIALSKKEYEDAYNILFTLLNKIPEGENYSELRSMISKRIIAAKAKPGIGRS